MKIGCCGNTDTYLQISKMGYDYTEISGRLLMALSDYQREDFISLYNTTGFPIPAINDYCGENPAIVGPNFSAKESRKYASALMKYASRLGVRSVGIGAPKARKLAEDYPRDKAMFEMLTFLYITCEEAAKYDIDVLLEAVHSGLCDYLNYTVDALAMVKAVRGDEAEDVDPKLKEYARVISAGRKRPENVYLVYDYYNAMVMGEELSDMISAMPYIRHLHYSTDLGDNDRGYPDESRLSELTHFLAMAADAGYKGNISVEANYSKYLNYEGDICARLMKMALPPGE